MTVADQNFAELARPFSPEAIHWRSQSIAANGTSALALAYIDARDVMARLDDVCGPANWQDRYTETPKGRIICTLSIRVGDEWIDKSDGAGNTDVEGDKGALSDALKRAAVKWGIGRYLYDLPATWAECDSYEKNGKKVFKDWTPQGLIKLARIAGGVAGKPAVITDAQRDTLAQLAEAANVPLLKVVEAEKIADLRELPADRYEPVCKRLNLTIEQNTAKEAA